MKKYLTNYLTLGLLLMSMSLAFTQTPVSKYGRLKLVGKQLSSECGNPVQLRGMSSHGIQWYRSCLDVTSLGTLVSDWNIDILRIAMYVGEGGYLTDSNTFKNTVNSYVNYCDRNGVYSIIDWHVLTPGDPNTNINEAKGFWNYMSKTHAGKKNVIYEICNEPNGNGVSWTSVKNYANTIIPIIRANDKEAIILVGTPNYSSDLDSPANSPLTGANAYNVMYTYHFYAASHMSRLGNFNNNTAKIPIFVSEWGVSDYTGGGSIDLNGAQQWIDNFNGTNAGGVKISWTNWNFSDAPETSAALTPKACANGTYTSLTASGTKVKYWISNPAKIGSACVFGPSCKTPSLGNDVSICGTAGGITLTSGLTPANRTFSWKKDGQTVSGSGPTLQVTQAGTYTVVVDSIGCSKSDEIIVSATLPSINLGPAVDLCKPPTAVLDAGVSGNGISYAWKLGGQPFGGNTKTIQISKAGTYSVTLSATGCQSSTGSLSVTSSQPNVIGDTVCVNGTANLKVVGSGNYSWYDVAQGGTSLKTGNTFNPIVTSTKTYYVEASAGQDYKIGPANSGTSPWNVTDYTTTDKKIVIQALANVILKSISVDASANQTVSINLTDQSTGTIVKTATLAVSAGFNIIPFNFNLISGKSYTVDGAGSTDALKFNNSSSVVWPQTVPNVATVSSGAPNYANAWSAFYDITFSTGTACDRVPVVAFVDPCTGIEDENFKQVSSNIFPNPFADNFTLNLGSHFKDVLKIEVTDQEGKIVEVFNGANVQPELQIGQRLSNGQYFVRIIRSDKVEMKSVIKLK